MNDTEFIGSNEPMPKVGATSSVGSGRGPIPIKSFGAISGGGLILAMVGDDDQGSQENIRVESEPEPVGNTLTFMTRAIFNVVAKHQEINGGYFIADGDVDDFVGRLAKVINSTFEPLKPRE